jgi:hypothetical protein
LLPASEWLANEFLLMKVFLKGVSHWSSYTFS